MVKEVQTCFNLDVERYMRVNFTALKDIVDVLGGVDITLTARSIRTSRARRPRLATASSILTAQRL